MASVAPATNSIPAKTRPGERRAVATAGRAGDWITAMARRHVQAQPTQAVL
jgi:hypothetical protein